MRNYGFRKLTAGDLPLMRRWLATAHVRVWWPRAETQLARMEQELTNPDLDMQVVSLGNHPFAFVQDHDARAFDTPEFADLPAGARAMATFVGDSDFLGPGHAVGYIAARTDILRRRFTMVAVAPNTTDTRAIDLFRQAGYRSRRLAPTRDGRLVQVMTRH